MEVDLPPTAALDQQDLLGGQLKRRREAEQECRRLEGENLKLRGSLGDLEAMVAVLKEENAQFGAERERLEGEIEALREQKDEAVAGAGALKKKVEGAYLVARREAERAVAKAAAAERREEKSAADREARLARRRIAELEAELCRQREDHHAASAALVEQADQAAREELELRVTATSKTSEAATRAASESANAVIRVVAEQREVRRAAAKMRTQAQAAEKVVHGMRKQIEELQAENKDLQRRTRSREEDLFRAAREAEERDRAAAEREREAEEASLTAVRDFERRCEELAKSMEERVERARRLGDDAEGRSAALLAELEGVRAELATQATRAAEFEAKCQVLESNLEEERSHIEGEIETAMSAYKKREDEIRAEARAEATQEALRSQGSLVDQIRREHALAVEGAARRHDLSLSRAEAALQDREFWEARARALSAERDGECAQETRAARKSGRARTLRLPGAELRKFLARGSRSAVTGGETSQVFRGNWKAEGGESFRPE